MSARYHRRPLLGFALLAAYSICLPALADAQAIARGRAITLVVSNTTNTTVDTLARLIAPAMSQSLGQPVVVENKPGGNGLVATALVAKAPADGSVLLIDSSTFALPAGPGRQASVDTAAAFRPVGVMGLFPYVLATYGPYRASRLSDLVSIAKRSPGEVAFASTGIGSAPHMAAAMLEDKAGIELLNIPYRNAGLALSDVTAHQVPVIFAEYAAVANPLKDGRLRALAVTGSTRLAQLPDVPTMAEAGVAGYEDYEWNPVVVRAGTDPSVVTQLARALSQAMNSPEYVTRLRELGGQPFASSAEAADGFVSVQRRAWTQTIKNRRIKLD